MKLHKITLLLLALSAITETRAACPTRSGSDPITCTSAPDLSAIQSTMAAMQDGDTLQVQAGSVNWDNELVISKGITVQGATTVDSTMGGLPTPSPYPSPPYSAATDKTNITRSNLNGGHTFVVQASNGKRIRLSGFTLTPGTSATSQGAIQVTGTMTDDPASGNGVRLDNLHLQNPSAGDGIHTFGCVFGVMDHCLIEQRNGRFLLIWHETYAEPLASAPRTYGDGAWADHANWGSYKFWFFEDNIFRGVDLATNTLIKGTVACVDAKRGGRYVLRHNRLFNSRGSNSHGTEGSGDNDTAERSTRAVENYRNNTWWSAADEAGGQMRGGNILFHDNNYEGALPNAGIELSIYREDVTFNGLGGVTGSNPWDSNNPGAGFVAGTAKIADPSPTPSQVGGGTMTVKTITTNTAGLGAPGAWTSNAFVGWFLTNTSRSATNAGGVTRVNYQSGRITSSGPDWVKTAPIGTDSFRPGVSWQPDDHFEIRKAFFGLDQAGRGKGSFIKYADAPNAGNDLGGTSVWPNELSEPSYSYNNTFGGISKTVLNIGSPFPTILSGGTGAYDATKSYYTRKPQTGDPAAPFTGGITPSGYTEYTYPHPLVGPAATLPVISSPTSSSANFSTSVAANCTTGVNCVDFNTSNFTDTTLVWDITVGSLPGGVSLNTTTGVVSGQPTGSTQSYDFTIRARGIITPSESATKTFTIFVAAPNGTPSCSITISAPPAGASIYTTDDTVTITATATDDGSIASVEFFDGATSLGTDSTGPSYTFASTFTSGGHTFTAKATDDLGAVSPASNTKSITVVPVTSSPTPTPPGPISFKP